MIQDMADYYLRLSDKLDGITEEVYDDDDVTRPAFSLYFFYGTDDRRPDGRRMGNCRNISSSRLLRAFFGDEHDLDDVKNDRREPLSDEEINEYAINGSYLNAAQTDAVKKALSNNITIIQGPPGTGKTEVILNILSCIHNKYPNDKVMLLSGNYEAVKNITDKINEGKDNNPMLRELFNVYLPLGNASVRRSTYKKRREHGLDADFFLGNNSLVDNTLLGNINILSSTIHSVKKLYTTRQACNMQYDYVIVDECSQVSILLGLIAMSCGKRIILLGDKEQLAPVIKSENVDSINNDARFNGIVDDIYMEKPEKSFLEVCENIFGNIEGTGAFLSGHYRCHPSIINFCNKYVYDNRLEVCTNTVGNGMADADKLMIRVLWYEGDHFESYTKTVQNDDGTEQHQNVNINQRQLDIFMNEEFHRIIDNIKKDDNYSACVIAPYRTMIEELNTAISEGYAELANEVDANYDENDYISSLTIHKVQGKGYDGVWFLSAQDVGSEKSWPWSQQKRMVNVAVSRAKKEFTVIASSAWMPKDLQFRLTDKYIEIKKPDDAENEKNNLLVSKLIEYVADDCAGLDAGELYGFRKAKTESLFDSDLYYRCHFSKNTSAPERIMMDYLIEEYSRDYDILCQIPFSAYSPCITSSEYISDFAICRDNKVLVIIEVDGGFHRSDPEQPQTDIIKDNAVAAAGTDTVVVRINTNDLYAEKTIAKALDTALEGDRFLIVDTARARRVFYNRKGGGLIKGLKKVIDKSFDDFCEAYKKDTCSEEVNAAIAANNYAAPDSNDFNYSNKTAADYYLCRYGIAYAFEYALIYSIVLKSMNYYGEQFRGLLSLGCGSMVDGWSMAYADSRLNYSNGHLPPRFRYMGVDCTEWNVRFIDRVTEGDKTVPSVHKKPFSEVVFFHGFVQDYFRSLGSDNDVGDYNVICFPKILNELNDAAADEIAEYFGNMKFPLNEYYICASHSRSKCDDGARRLKRIIDKINRSDEFEVTYDIPEMNIDDDTILKAIYPKCPDELTALDADAESCMKSYVFNSSIQTDENAVYINKIDSNFYMRRITDAFAKMQEEDDGIRSPIIRVSQLTFQIVRLKRSV